MVLYIIIYIFILYYFILVSFGSKKISFLYKILDSTNIQVYNIFN